MGEWNRRDWIKVVGLTTAGLAATKLNALGLDKLGLDKSQVKYIDGELYIPRERYAYLFGPTVGDRVRLADTELIIEIEKDFNRYGEENMFGGGKTIRDGMAQSARALRDDDVLDFCISNVIVVDHWGIVKGDVGIKDGKIVAVGKAGNPDVQDGVTPGMVIGASTEVHNGAGMLLTAGGIDTHIHFISPTQVETALYSGVTTFIGGGTGPADGSNATTVTGGKWWIHKMLESFEDLPINVGIFGKGNVSTTEPIEEQIEAGALGVKIHEDWGATPATIDAALKVADKYDVQVAIHTDTLNEAGFLEDTVAAIDGRVIHTFHTEGAGGGHAPDIIKISMYPNILPASTNPTKPFTVNTEDEHLDMLIVVHHLSKDSEEDMAFADSRIRPQSIAAEDVLQDMGVFSIMSSDSQAMGRVGEVISRTYQTAHKMKIQRGALDQDKNSNNDNFRVKRYTAKFTINPAKAHGIDKYVGSVEPGKHADLVLWKPEMFGVKPEMIIKGGMILSSKMGDANGSIPMPQPVVYRQMFGNYGKAKTNTCFNFVSKVSIDNGSIESLGLARTSLPVEGCRTVMKKDMVHNDATPNIEVDPETYDVKVDGVIATCEPLAELPMAQRYFLF